jgi:phospholipid N-methyltransferase
MKLSKPQIKAHEQAEDLLKKDNLLYDEKLFVYENWFPAYGNQIGKIASYFTPLGLANDFGIEVSGYKVIDLCAGIGLLSFLHYHKVKCWESKEVKTVCIEQNAEFVKVGKLLFPEATWIEGDVLDETLIKSLGQFDMAISNPPYGNIKTGSKEKWLKYSGGEFELKVIEVGSYLATFGAYIMPPLSTPFEFSGRNYMNYRESAKYVKFNNQTGIVMDASCGIDTSFHKDDWKGTVITTEIVTIDYTQRNKSHTPWIRQEIKETKEELQLSWSDLFGENPDDFTPAERRKRWDDWKRKAIEAGDNDVVEYWSNKEACTGCRHLEPDGWCSSFGLPCTVNPILTIKEGIIGMACMGTGREEIKNEQLSLFDAP